MSQFFGILLLGSALITSSFADDDRRDRDRDRDYRNNRGYGYGDYRNDRYGYGDDRYGTYRNGGYGSDRALFQSVNNNLRRAASEGRGLSSRERDRYDNAFRRLREFYSRYQEGRWDKGKLDQAIEDVDNVVKHNPMSSRSRHVLTQDLYALRDFRSRGGSGNYGYRSGGGWPW